jgi:hypothetical protein
LGISGSGPDFATRLPRLFKKIRSYDESEELPRAPPASYVHFRTVNCDWSGRAN